MSAWVKGVQHQRGDANNTAKLTAYDVEQIRRDPRSHATLAAIYGVSFDTISRARRRLTWKHVA